MIVFRDRPAVNGREIRENKGCQFRDDDIGSPLFVCRRRRRRCLQFVSLLGTYGDLSPPIFSSYFSLSDPVSPLARADQACPRFFRVLEKGGEE